LDLEDRLTTALSNRYRIEAEIDTGGMASVYRARDLKHDRTVAIKVLRPDLAEAIGTDRFLREIRTTANLSHPHILPLFDSGEADGFLFYVMPFVEGESLGDRLEREGQLPVEDAIQIAREVADALAYAHDKGVIHRDIKPANILLERGHALLADFGIAQAKAGAEETKLTGSGMSLGTPSYMSPEQITGNREMDGRSDQYALASVLFEMLAGHAPFTGADIQAVMRQHLAADAPSMTQARPTVPKGVAKAVHRALAKSPGDRFRTMPEFEKALAGATLPLLARIPLGRARAAIFAVAVVLGLAVVAVIASVWRPAPAPVFDPRRLVVIPFQNLTGDPSLDNASVAVTARIAECLDLTGLVEATGSNSVQTWWSATEERRTGDPNFDYRQAIAQYFEAGMLIQGSILLEGDGLSLRGEFMESNRLHVVQRVVPAQVPRDDPYDEAGVAALCDALAAGLAYYLDPTIVKTDEAVGQYAIPRSVAALREFRAAQDAYYDGSGRVMEHLENTIELDPDFVPAKVGLAVVYSSGGNPGQADSILREVEDYLDQLPPGNRADARWLRANLEGDRLGAYNAIKNGHSGTPDMIWVWAMEALALNRPREALEVLSTLDPDGPLMSKVSGYWITLSAALHELGDHERELREVREGWTRHPDDLGLLLIEARAQGALGDLPGVQASIDELILKGDRTPFLSMWYAALELRAHGHWEGYRTVAERGIAYLQGRPAEEKSSLLYRRQLHLAHYLLEEWEDAFHMAEELVRAQPENPGFIGMLGRASARTGRRDDALRIARQLESLEIPYDRGQSTYSRACIHALLGESEEAVNLLEEAHEQGWRFSRNFHIDMDLEELRGFPRFEEFARPKG
jgi:tRNA A-37 threonylcarbamoyl transferase component Bud32/tetratricopeptide (TPR) repeat protein